eukprot:TRINITY_DN11908_c0_g1_i1.p1 TRINITY_DN11908_c0_g1~~TRINITY_DN11908_c0_g1_i1.p1  ORF type:complete len:357 (+),score=97.00 TRINITY_DN11908_c0_g1_i1:59-1129(+)
MWGSDVKHIKTVDAHCCGEPARVVIDGLPSVEGTTMLEKRQYCMEKLDHVRKLLLTEPRGYPCQNADYIVPACDEKAAYGVIIVEQGKVYPAMSGHNLMCVATVIVETNMVVVTEPKTDFVLETPAGLINVSVKVTNSKAEAVTLYNVPSWCEKRDVVVKLPQAAGLPSSVTIDIAFGGMWYAVVPIKQTGIEIKPANGKALCRLGEVIKAAAKEQHPVNHPEYDYPGPDILVFVDQEGGVNRNTVIMSNGELRWDDEMTWTAMIDRSPCGTGTCAVMATLFSRGKLSPKTPFHHRSIIDTCFVGVIESTAEISNGKQGILPSITGQAWITQYCDVVVHPTDPFPEGYTVGDIWSA